jgi:predicted transcriptional regulator
MPHPTSIRLTDKLKSKLRSWAKAEERTLTAHIAWLLEQAVRWHEKQGEKK